MIFFLQQSYVRHTAILLLSAPRYFWYVILYDTNNFTQSSESIKLQEFSPTVKHALIRLTSELAELQLKEQFFLVSRRFYSQIKI